MIGAIARKEFTEMCRDGRFRWSVGVLLVWLTLAFVVGWFHYRESMTMRSAAQNSQREQWLNKTASTAHLAAHAGVVVFRPYLPLSALDKGLNDFVGTSMFLEAHRRNEFQNKAVEQTSLLRGFGEMSTALTLQVLLPLLIVLLAYPAFAAERERGTLRQCLSLGVSKRELALGKALGVAAPILAVLLPLLVIGGAALVFTRSLRGADNLARLILFLVSYLLYALVFLGVCLLVSAVSRSARLSLALLLGFWLLACLIAPMVASDLGERLWRTPTVLELAAMKPDKETANRQYKERMATLRQEMLAKYGVQDVKDLPVDLSSIMLAKSEEEGSRHDKAAFDRVYDQYEKQNRFYQALGALAPILAAQTISMSLAGEDVFHYRHFAEAAEDYRYAMVQTLNDDLINHPRKGDRAAQEAAYRERERELYARVPDFSYRSPDWRWVVGKTRVALIALALWGAGIAISLPIAVKRIRPD